MKHATRLSWTLGLAIAAPVMALTGCPGLFGGAPTATTSPSVGATTSPSPSATPKLRTTLVLTKLSFPQAAASRSFTVKNLGSSEVDLTKWVVSYEYFDSTDNALKMQHLRFGNGKKLAPGASHTIYDVACTGSNTECVSKEDGLGGTGATTMGLQVAAGGSMAIYKSINSSADLTNANMVDYMQYGTTARNYTHAAAAVANGFWEATGSLAPAAAVDKSLQVKTEGATGSTNWELK